MAIRITKTKNPTALKDEVERRTNIDLSVCFQCKKCSSGCPVSDFSAAPPSEIMRRLQLGEGDTLLSSDLIWVCASCETCTARCPMGIDIAAIMDTLRHIARERNKVSGSKTVPSFNRAFLDTVRLFGRSYEIGMVAAFKLANIKKVFADTEKFPAMLKKGKISLTPSPAKDKGMVRRIFKHFKNSQHQQHKRGTE